MILQLNPPIPVHVIDRGNGFAFLVTDYSQEHHKLWTVAMDDTGEVWDVPNPLIRMQWNWSMGRNKIACPKNEKSAS